MSNVVAKQCWVSGRVQGVFFRASTRQQAIDLGISGYAKNLDDGRVEVLAVGESASIQKLLDWLKIGPPAARVDAVNVEDIAVDEIQGLQVGFSAR